jgi:predicted MFS family arabinose efflux permease
VSAANAAAPIVMGLLFQHYGEGIPFLVGGIMMAFLALIAFIRIKAPEEATA